MGIAACFAVLAEFPGSMCWTKHRPQQFSILLTMNHVSWEGLVPACLQVAQMSYF
jgi:hypothetical protein